MLLGRAPRGPPPRATGTARQLEGGHSVTATYFPPGCRDFLSMGLSRLSPNSSLSKGVKVAKTQRCPWQRGVTVDRAGSSARVGVERYLWIFFVFVLNFRRDFIILS